MAKKPGLSAAFTIGEQPILDVPNKFEAKTQPKDTPTPLPNRRDHRANRQAFTVWLDRELVLKIRELSRDLVSEHGRAGNSIEALVTEGIEHILAKHDRT
ncbi:MULTISPECIES: hypothetical protein [unclassified Methylobacterium]|jgi:hypothetical protein|uniref:hypothetical protein n=1 Tax=unclassified Methylobacterium TaxID=2615210 RepID=UPI0012E25800|nr:MULTISPECIES: hypothetical protein [unclassified Methylobacterium]USU34582.1 hypothetical protein NG677_23475 [Methylobacterium sp.]